MSSPSDPVKTRQIELVLEGLDTLPTLSPIATRLLSLGSTDTVEIDEIVDVIEVDPALSTRILGLCRRSDRGASSKITTVRRAVIMLGIDAVRSAVLSVSVYDVMSRDREGRKALDDKVAAAISLGDTVADGPAFDRRGFWKHAVAVACAAELMAAMEPKLGIAPDEAFLAGLLHDLGRMVLDYILPMSYDRVLRGAERGASDTSGLERQIIGIDHHAAGRRVAEQWRLPEAVRDAMLHYATPAALLPAVKHRNLIAVVGVAKALCRRLHLGWCGDFGMAPDPERLWAEAGLPRTGPQALIPALNEAVRHRLEVLGLYAPASPSLLLESVANANRQLSRMNTTLNDRAALAQSQAKVLDNLAEFLVQPARWSTLLRAADAVLDSANAALAGGFQALLVQEGPGEPWQLLRRRTDSDSAHSRVLDQPPSHADQLFELVQPKPLSLSVLGLLPWLTDGLSEMGDDGGDPVPDLRTLRLIPLVNASRELGEGACALLITDREPESAGLKQQRLAALTHAWGIALAASILRERERRQTELAADAARSLREAEMRLADRESMARLGEMTSGAAHEMNNPLTIISGRAQLLASRLTDQRDRDAAQAIVQSARDLTGLITTLHLIAEPSLPSPKVVSLAAVVRDAAMAAARRAGRDDHEDPPVDLDLDQAPTAVELDPDALVGILVELLTNAFEADPDKRLLVVATIDREDRLCLCVRDQGPGMSPHTMRHAFDPFFSVKPAGRQRGLGLTKARRLAESIDAQISLDSAPGRGTLATLVIGRWRPAADAGADTGSIADAA